MPRKRSTPAIGPLEKEFLEALQRLIDNVPGNPGLQRLAKLGRLRINYSTVAKEAGRSRTLIGMDGCRYPSVRSRIQAAMEPVVAPRTAEDVIRRLRENNAALRRKLKLANSLSLAMVRRYEDLAKRRERDRHESIGEKVIPIDQKKS